MLWPSFPSLLSVGVTNPPSHAFTRRHHSLWLWECHALTALSPLSCILPLIIRCTSRFRLVSSTFNILSRVGLLRSPPASIGPMSMPSPARFLSFRSLSSSLAGPHLPLVPSSSAFLITRTPLDIRFISADHSGFLVAALFLAPIPPSVVVDVRTRKILSSSSCAVSGRRVPSSPCSFISV